MRAAQSLLRYACVRPRVTAGSRGEDAVSTRDERDEPRLTIDIGPELRKRVELAAAERGMTVRDYVAAALLQALESYGIEQRFDESARWSRLSIPSFARDWKSDADAIYDDLA
jgi:hypothetical protein